MLLHYITKCFTDENIGFSHQELLDLLRASGDPGLGHSREHHQNDDHLNCPSSTKSQSIGGLFHKMGQLYTSMSSTNISCDVRSPLSVEEEDL